MKLTMIDGIGTSSGQLMTAEQLERVEIPGKATELIRGQLIIREPPGTYHGQIAARLVVRVGAFVEIHQLGEVFAQDTGFKIASNPDTVRAPDLAFVARDRLSQVRRRGYAALAPDLVAEVLSPDDRPGEALAKIGDWLTAGVKLAWLFDPDQRNCQVYRPGGSASVAGVDDAIQGENVLPGFHFLLSDLYRD